MRVIVTGASGFIGAQIVFRLAVVHEVIALVRRVPEIKPAGVSFVVADLRQPLNSRLLPGRTDAVIHLAQANSRLPDGATDIFAVATVATQALLEYARRAGARRFLLASSGDVYGYRLGPCRESDPPVPVSYYGATKYAAELLVGAYAASMETCSLRLFRPYGPGQTNRLIPKLANQVQAGKPIHLNKDDRPRMSPLYITDVVTAFEHVLHSSFSGTLNVSGDEVVSIRELAEQIGQVLGRRPLFTQTGDESGDLIGDNRLMKEVFGTWRLIGLTEGLARVLTPEVSTWRP